MNNVGISYEKLRLKRFLTGKTWQEVKKEVGVSNEVIARINKDEYISLQSLELFCKYFECNFGDLIDYVERKKKA